MKTIPKAPSAPVAPPKTLGQLSAMDTPAPVKRRYDRSKNLGKFLHKPKAR